MICKPVNLANNDVMNGKTRQAWCRRLVRIGGAPPAGGRHYLIHHRVNDYSGEDAREDACVRVYISYVYKQLAGGRFPSDLI
jgi:hypothetical protein